MKWHEVGKSKQKWVVEYLRERGVELSAWPDPVGSESPQQWYAAAAFLETHAAAPVVSVERVREVFGSLLGDWTLLETSDVEECFAALSIALDDRDGGGKSE